MIWQLVIELEWPSSSVSSTHAAALDFEALIRECIDPLHRENVMVYGVRLEQVSDEP